MLLLLEQSQSPVRPVPTDEQRTLVAEALVQAVDVASHTAGALLPAEAFYGQLRILVRQDTALIPHRDRSAQQVPNFPAHPLLGSKKLQGFSLTRHLSQDDCLIAKARRLGRAV